jgi:predicted nucleotidyltransferase
MNDAAARVVEPFLSDVDVALGTGYSAILYGSAARGDFVAGRSDVNVMLVLDDVSPPVLRSLAPAFARWRKTEHEPPLLMSRSEWAGASDAFPLEIADMQSAYRVLRGPDPLDGVRVEPADLRRALERELHGKLLRLRQGYAALSRDEVGLGQLAIGSAPNIVLLMRGMLTLLGRHLPQDSLELVVEAAAVVGFQTEEVASVVRHRGDRKWRCTATQFEDYLEAVESTVRFVDQLQLGEHR